MGYASEFKSVEGYDQKGQKNYTRSTYVKDVWIDYHDFNDIAHPKNRGLTDIKSEVWLVYLQLSTGTLPTICRTFLFESEADAEEFANNSPEYQSWNNIIPDAAHQISFRGFRSEIDETIHESTFHFAYATNHLANEVLLNYGLADGPIYASDLVIKYLGVEKINKLRSRFSKKWGAVAIFDYCRHMYGAESIQFIAANYKFQMEVAEDHFAAGYLLRDLELGRQGVERRVLTALANDVNFGKVGKVSRKEEQRKRTL